MAGRDHDEPTATRAGPAAQARRAAAVRRVVRETMARRDRGEAVAARAVEAAHPDLMPELARELALLDLVERARADASVLRPDAAPAPVIPEPASEGFDGYDVVREAHRGGQGVVYEAVQGSTGRRVAIKVMREGLFSGDRDAPRFEREVRILGQLTHPGIVGIIGSGVRAGHFWYSMEYVEGEPLDRWAESHRPGTPAILGLFARVCDAVAAAHVRGIIHRDLKPANILVDERGDPRILDFGLARIVSDPDAGRMTMTGQFVGSMPWASPEQAAGDQNRVDVRTDVYSLGVVLYQLLTGRFPYPVEGSPRDVLDSIQSAEPARMRSVAGGIDEDAEAIVLKCLSKERERRYQSASALADDLRRLLAGHGVVARPPSVSYQIRSFARRHRPLVIGATAVLGVLVLGLVGTSLGLIEASAARRGLRRERDAAVAAERAAERQAYVAGIAAADAALRALDAGTARTRLNAAPASQRGWEWSHLMDRSDGSLGTIPGEYLAAAPTPGGDAIVVIRTDGTAAMLDASSFSSRWTLELPIARREDGWRAWVGAFGAGGRVALHYGPQVFLVEVASGRLLRACAFDRGEWGHVHSAFPPDGLHLAVNGIEGQLRVWEVDSGTELFRSPVGHASSGVAYTPDGRFLCIDTSDALELLDSRTFERARRILIPGSPAEYGHLMITSDGLHAVTIRDFSPLIIELESGRLVARCDGHTQRAALSGFGPDGRLITCSWDRTIRLWDTRTGHEEGVLMGHSGQTYSAGFFDGGTRIVSASADGTLRFWDAAITPDVERLTPGETVLDLGVAEAGGDLLAQCVGGLRRWDSATWLERARETLTIAPGGHPSYSPDGRAFAYATEPGSLALRSAGDRDPGWTVTGLGSPVGKISFTQDGRLLAAPHFDGTIRVFSAADGTVVRVFSGARYTGARPVFVPGGTLLLAPGTGGSLVFCDLTTGETESVTAPAIPPSHEVLSMVCSPDGRVVASAHNGGTVVLWDATTRRPMGRLTGMDPTVWCVAFSPDGTRLATGSQDRMVRVWDPADGAELLVLRGHTGTVMALAWSPDGRTLFSGGYDGTIRRWHAP